MSTQKHVRRPPAATQVELDVVLGAAERAVGRLVYVRAGQREFSQFAYREDWLSDPRYFDVSPDLDKAVGYQVRRAATKEDSVFFHALADTEPELAPRPAHIAGMLALTLPLVAWAAPWFSSGPKPRYSGTRQRGVTG